MYRFTGHETFPCRYTWLPKTVAALENKPDLFRDIDEAIVALGVGKQMARAIRFWVEAAKVVKKQEKGDFKVSPLGKKLLDKKVLIHIWRISKRFGSFIGIFRLTVKTPFSLGIFL